MFHFDFTQLFNIEVLMEVLVFLFGLATLVSLVISGLKARGVIPDGAAGKWLGGLTLAISALTGVITQLGYGEAVGPVNEWAVGMAGLLVMFVIVVLQSKIVYIGLKWVGVVFSYSQKRAA